MERYKLEIMVMRFLIYGSLGWIMEVIWTGLHSFFQKDYWTGLHSFFQKDYSLTAKTYLWMFPIYGLVVCMEPIFIRMQRFPWFLRGGVYMGCIFFAEFVMGFLLEKSIGVCPWDYKESRFQVRGWIRLDYGFVWFFVGLLMEWLYFRLVFFF